MRTSATILAATLVSACCAAATAQVPRFAGHWQGAIVLAAGEQEVNLTVELHQTGGQLTGQLWFPMTEDGAHPLEEVSVQGPRARFSVRDNDGVVSTFDGVLSPDGASLAGTMKENQRALPFTLRRTQATRPAAAVRAYRLSNDARELKAAFNSDAAKTRLLLLLKTGSFSSKMALRMVERYVMDQISDPNLRVYVVWTGPDRPQAETLVEKDVQLGDDSRITHFWSTDPLLDSVFDPILAPYKPVSNACLLFAPDRTWAATAPPPDRLRQSARVGSKTAVQPGQKLNGSELAADVKLLLAVKKGR